MVRLATDSLVESCFGEARRIPTEYFFDEILPPLHPKLDVDEVLATIKRSDTKGRRPITQDGRWRGVAKDLHSSRTQKRLTGSNFSGPFKETVHAIAKAGAVHGAHSSLKLLHNVIQGNDFNFTEPEALSDAYFVSHEFVEDNHLPTLEDVSVAGNYTHYPSEHDAEMVYAKIHQSLASMVHDPRRRFAFGYVVRNTLLEVWYCDKEQALVSEPIEWIADHRSVIHLFLSFLFAEPHHLGWDPTVSLFKVPNNESRYEFVVEGRDGTQKVYRSLDLLPSINSAITGNSAKATHVWKVVEVRDGAPHGIPVVLKDCWRHEELAREGDNIEAIWRDTGNLEGIRHVLSRSFLTVLHHGDVIIRSDSDREPPHLDNLRLHLENAVDFAHGRTLKDSRIILPGEPFRPHRDWAGKAAMLGRRIHYRIVSEEVRSPLTLTSSIRVACTALAEISEVINVLHESNWVHGDIGIDNILLDADGHARLINLEFAKKCANEDLPEVPIGNPKFRAAEVHRQHYLFRPCKLLARPDIGAAELVRMKVDNGAPDVRRVPSWALSPYPPFCYRPLHDRESLWWLMVFLLFRWDADGGPEDADPGPAEAKHRHELQNTYARIFGKSYERDRVMTDDGFFYWMLCSLRPRMQQAGLVLEWLREQLVVRYKKSEHTSESATKHDFEGLHDAFVKTLRNVCTVLTTREDLRTMDANSGSPTPKHYIATEDDDATQPPEPSAKRNRSG